jgi:ATP-dependent DNA helicase RecG
VEQGDDEEREGKAAVEAQFRLQQEIFPDLRISLLHGRMKGDEKDAVLQAFKNREADILVSTSVIEVGVDVPNATVMLIEGADHFGLAQLHQFRGRVGRGADRSYCILIPENDSAAENERLKAMTETNDGFKLAEYDLNMRGPGDFIGNRQSGFMDLRLASLTDIRLIEKARAEAEKLFEQDPDLSSEANQFLKDEVDKALQSRSGEIS